MLQCTVLLLVQQSSGEGAGRSRLFQPIFQLIADIWTPFTLADIFEDANGVDYACDVVLRMEFDAPESLRTYASHPAR